MPPGEPQTEPPDPSGLAATSPNGSSGSMPGRRRVRSEHPNYTARRIVTIGAILSGIVVVGYAVAAILGGTDNDGGFVPTDWNTFALVEGSNGTTTVSDRGGDEVLAIDGEVGRIGDTTLIGSTLVLDGGDRVQITSIDDDADNVEVVDLDGSRRAGIATVAGTLDTVIVGDSGRVVAIHGPSGERVDSDTATPVAGVEYSTGTAIADPSGRHVLIGDTGNFQSVLFSFDNDEPSYFPGRPIAVDGDVVVSAQNVGTQGTVSVFDHDGDPRSMAKTPPIVGGIVSSGRIVIVTVDGQVMVVDAGSGRTKTTAQLGVAEDEGDVDVDRTTTTASSASETTTPTGSTGDVATMTAPDVNVSRVMRSPGGDRLVVESDVGVAIVDDRGAIVGEFADHTLADPFELAVRGTECVALARPDDAVRLVEWSDATVVADPFPGLELTTADGCTVIATDGTLVSPDGSTELDVDGTPIALAPDGSVVVIDDGHTLTAVSLDSDDEIELGPSSLDRVLFGSR